MVAFEDLKARRSWRVFWRITAFPKTAVVLGEALIAWCAIYIPSLVKDTRSDAFLPADEPALVYRDKVKEIFGLTDPMVIAVASNDIHGVFNPDSLALVNWLTEGIKHLQNVDPDRVTSLATENNITGYDDGMRVEPFWKSPPRTQRDADGVRAAVMDFPLYVGSLVAEDGSATMIVAEVLDQTQAQALYRDLTALAAEAPKAAGDHIYVAGEGAVSGYLGSYIDADAQRLNPLAAIIITTVLFIAFRTPRGALLPNFVVLGTIAAAIGLMAATGVKFFVITNGLLPVLIGDAVADSIHIFSQYYEEQAKHPDESGREIVVRTMVELWRPITMTTLTTQAGFLGLYLVSVMPPMKYFGLFAMVGVGAAWVFSVTVVPGWLSVLKLKPSPAHREGNNEDVSRGDVFGRAMTVFGQMVTGYPKTVLTLAAAAAAIGVYEATQMELNEARIRVFQKDEPIVVADAEINRSFNGVHYLDILVETPNPEDIFYPQILKKIDTMQAHLETLPHVGGTTSVVDYLKQMNRLLSGGRPDAYALPDDKDLIAQYFLLYSASADPTDFQKVVDYDYRLANVRVSMDSGKYSGEKVVVEAAQRYLDTVFNVATDGPSSQAHLSGRVNVDYHWIRRLGETNWGSVAVALLLVWLMAAIAFRSIVAGVITVIPVTLTVFLVYAVMAFNGIWLSISTSMFAAIAIGLGVDFAIHTIERIEALVRDEHRNLDESLALLFPTTGRALLFNFLALGLGFGVMVTSKVVVLQEFGGIVALAVAISFFSSLTLLPAIVKVFRPAFLGLKSERSTAFYASEST